jgi:ubiquinone/menaquinone biosynthesis C-methylase UbiE
MLCFGSIYNFINKILGSKKATLIFVNEYIKPKMGDEILDFGCGTSSLLSYLKDVKDLTYVGIDPNSHYIKKSLINFSFFKNAQFYVGSIEVMDSINKKFDIIVLSAVLHHVSTEHWSSILEKLYSKLKPGGRIVLLDNVFHSNQNFISKLLISLDRGKSVVNISRYLKLVSGNYIIDYDLRLDLLNFPYSHLITTIK